MVLLNLVYGMLLFDRRFFSDWHNDFIERFNEYGILIVSVMVLSMLTISDGEIYFKFGLIMNYTIIFWGVVNILYVASFMI